MNAGKPLRKISDPIVAAGPSGCRFRTRLHLSDTEAAALVQIGEFLGGCYRRELVGRVRLGRMGRDEHKRWRATRKQALTAVSSSRWAGAITRAVEDQYQLGMRGLAAHVADLHSAVDVLDKRCSLRPGEQAADDGDSGRGKRRGGYGTASERFAKTRRLAILRQRLVVAEDGLAEARPSITVGGKRLWRTRTNLAAAGPDKQQWRRRWDGARMFLTADGETGKPGGNETIRVDGQGRLQIKVPADLVNKLGGHLQFAAPVRFNHGGDVWAARVDQRKAVRYDIVLDPQRGRWYLDASWAITPEPSPELEELRDGRVLGVDLNADHLAACVLDSSGNPVAEPVTIALDVKKLRASHRDGHLRAAITELLDVAQRHSCVAIAVENLNFADSRATGRETMGRGGRGKKFRRTVAGIPTAKFRDRLTAMATRRGISIIGVDPAYTSQWGDEHWRKPLQQQTSGEVTRHHGAAAAIGRRGLGKPIRRRPAGPRTQQRMGVGTPPARPVKLPGSPGVRKAPIHRHTREVCRSIGQHRNPAAKTVRAATGQNSLLLSD